MQPSILWLIAGIVLCGAEAALGPGIGLFFAGLAAVVVAALTAFGLVAQQNYVAQGAWFFALTALWAVLLWKPMQRFRSQRGNGYTNMIGDEAEVIGEPITRARRGQARWSGTIMLAELAPDAPHDTLPLGARVTIVGVKGNRLIVK